MHSKVISVRIQYFFRLNQAEKILMYAKVKSDFYFSRIMILTHSKVISISAEEKY